MHFYTVRFFNGFLFKKKWFMYYTLLLDQKNLKGAVFALPFILHPKEPLYWKTIVQILPSRWTCLLEILENSTPMLKLFCVPENILFHKPRVEGFFWMRATKHGEQKTPFFICWFKSRCFGRLKKWKKMVHEVGWYHSKVHISSFQISPKSKSCTFPNSRKFRF